MQNKGTSEKQKTDKKDKTKSTKIKNKDTLEENQWSREQLNGATGSFPLELPALTLLSVVKDYSVTPKQMNAVHQMKTG